MPCTFFFEYDSGHRAPDAGIKNINGSGVAVERGLNKERIF